MLESFFSKISRRGESLRGSCLHEEMILACFKSRGHRNTISAFSENHFLSRIFEADSLSFHRISFSILENVPNVAFGVSSRNNEITCTIEVLVFHGSVVSHFHCPGVFSI